MRFIPSRDSVFIFFFNDTATTEIYTLSLHDALPIWWRTRPRSTSGRRCSRSPSRATCVSPRRRALGSRLCCTTCNRLRSEEHTSELQSQSNLVCRLLLEKKKKHLLR